MVCAATTIKRALCLLMMVGCGWSVAAQVSEAEKQSIIEQRLEVIAGALEEDDDLDYTNLLEDLTYYFDHPLNLNTADVDELRSLYLLTDIQILALQRHIAKYGKLQSLFELQAVSGFDITTIRLIQPFVTIQPGGAMDGISWKDVLRDGNSDLFLRYRRTLQTQAGYEADPETGAPDYAGSPDYLYSRYRFSYKRNLIVGFTLEKDAGESLDKGPDFYSAHVFYRGNRIVKALAIGDYQAQFGQGLTFWNGLGFGKSPFVMNVKKNASGLRPYTSVNESLFLRGGAVTLGKKSWEATAFYSSRALSANLEQSADSLVTDDGLVVSSINISGLHRTESEIANRDALHETIIGGHARYIRPTFSAGVTAAHLRYDAPRAPSEQPYQQFRFSGTENLNLGLDYQGVFRNTSFFGEFSRSRNGGLASVNGFVSALHPRLSASVVHRWFQPEYQVSYANVFAEGNQLLPSNESGLYMGLTANFAKGWTLSAYSDDVRFPWLRFRSGAPGTLTDRLVQLNWKPDRRHEFYVRYRYRLTGEDDALADVRIDYPVDRIVENFRLNAIYRVHENVQLRTRAEWSFWRKEGLGHEQGFVLYQDIIWKKMGTPVSVNLRYALFETDSWNTRIYAYESDVLYAFSIPAYYGRGVRYYALVKYDIRRGLDLWVRLAVTDYSDRSVISSGNSQIDGSTKSDLTVQLRWQF